MFADLQIVLVNPQNLFLVTCNKKINMFISPELQMRSKGTSYRALKVLRRQMTDGMSITKRAFLCFFNCITIHYRPAMPLGNRKK